MQYLCLLCKYEDICIVQSVHVCRNINTFNYDLLPVAHNFISSYISQVEAYVNDPLIYHGAVKAGWSSAMLKSIEIYQPRINEINIPLLIMHGTEDSLVPFSASQLVNDNASSSDKTFEVMLIIIGVN